MSVCRECCVLSGRGLCDELITRPEESYRQWCVAVCDLETSWMSRPWPTGGCNAIKQTNKLFCVKDKSEVLVPAMKAYRGVAASRHGRLTPSPRCRRPWWPLKRRLDGHPGQSWRPEEERYLLRLPSIEPRLLARPASVLGSQLTAQTRLNIFVHRWCLVCFCTA
jgi:hypothetical protein